MSYAFGLVSGIGDTGASSGLVCVVVPFGGLAATVLRLLRQNWYIPYGDTANANLVGQNVCAYCPYCCPGPAAKGWTHLVEPFVLGHCPVGSPD